MSPEGRHELLVAQPGGAYAVLFLEKEDGESRADSARQGSERDLTSLSDTAETKPNHTK